MNISAKQVKDLRDQTGAGFMDCKKALVEAEGDIEAALEKLQLQEAEWVAGRSDRTTSEGVVAIHKSAIVEVLCETDFVARNEKFLEFADKVAREYFAGTKATGLDIDQELAALSATTGENIRIGTRSVLLGHPFSSYLHSNQQLGAVVSVKGGASAEEVAHNVAMHVVASNPKYLDATHIPEKTKEKKAELFRAQAEELKKPPHILDKIVQGKIRKWQNSICLLTQPYVKDSDVTIDEYLKKEGVEVLNFQRLQVGM